MGDTMKARLWGVLATLLSALAVAAYLGLPGMWQWEHAEMLVAAKQPHQTLVAEQAVDPALVERMRTTGDGTEFGPVVITYHDIGYHQNKYTVTPENFAAQMRLIHDAGWTTLTSRDIEAWMNGGLLPQRSVWITFDDGAMGVWKYADPVLARYNMHAAAFVITGFMDHYDYSPYYMTWHNVHDMYDEGRWDIEAHSHLGHVQVPDDDHGGTGPFFTAAQWLPELRRVETPAEQQARWYHDLQECQDQFAQQGMPLPRFFAYPFSAHEDDPDAADDILQDMVLSLYRGAMLDDSESTNMTTPEDLARGMLNRMDTMADVTPARFVQKMEEATTT
jgi:hypothetical protein